MQCFRSDLKGCQGGHDCLGSEGVLRLSMGCFVSFLHLNISIYLAVDVPEQIIDILFHNVYYNCPYEESKRSKAFLAFRLVACQNFNVAYFYGHTIFGTSSLHPCLWLVELL